MSGVEMVASAAGVQVKCPQCSKGDLRIQLGPRRSGLPRETRLANRAGKVHRCQDRDFPIGPVPVEDRREVEVGPEGFARDFLDLKRRKKKPWTR